MLGNLPFKQNKVFSNGRLVYFLPPLLVCLILLAVYFIKGIYPFGAMTVSYGDMDQCYVPISYHIYDVFYHGKSLFWDPFCGTGSNVYGALALTDMFSPISWLVVLTSRENIPNFISFLLMVRMALLSVTSFVFMNKLFKSTGTFWKVSLSLMYAFSGYVLIFYTNVAWIDCAILFPLFLLALKDLYEKDRVAGYLFMLSANLVVSYYISFMVLLFTFFSAGVFLTLFVEKERRRKCVVNLGIGTVGALLLTAVVTVPAFIQSSASIRFGGFSYPEVIGTDASGSVAWNKAVFFFFSAAALVILIRIFMDYRKNRKKTIALLLLLMLTGTQVIVEAVNKLWYGGSYVCYPLRFGFIPIFLILAACAWYFSEDFIKEGTRSKPSAGPAESGKSAFTVSDIKRIPAEKQKSPHCIIQTKRFRLKTAHLVFAVIGLAAYLGAVLLGIGLGEAVNETLYGYWGIKVESSRIFLVITILFGIAAGLLLLIKNKKIRYVLLTVLFLTEIVTHSIWYIGVPARTESDHIDDWSVVANGLNRDLGLSADNTGTGISRYKDADAVLNASYPWVLGGQSVSSYLHIIEERQQDTFKQLGYSTNYTRLLDTGGTIFSDMVLNVEHYLTLGTYSPDLFEPESESGDIRVYRNKYSLPDGIVYPASEEAAESDGLDLPTGGSAFDNQNFIYRTLFDESEDLIGIVETVPTTENMIVEQDGKTLIYQLKNDEIMGKIKYDFSVSGSNYVYLWTAGISAGVHFKVNGEVVRVPTIGYAGNTSYPASYNNGILNLGLYHDEKVEFEIITGNDIAIESLVLGILPVETLKTLSIRSANPSGSASGSDASPLTGGVVIDGNTIRTTVNAKGDGLALFLPVNFDNGWTCTINEKPVQIDKAFGTFISLDLSEGENEIELRFVPTGFALSATLSGAMVVFLLTCLLLKKRKKAHRIGQNGGYAGQDSQSVQESQSEQGQGKSARARWDSFRNMAMDATLIAFWSVYIAALFFVYIIPILSFIIRNVRLILTK